MSTRTSLLVVTLVSVLFSFGCGGGSVSGRGNGTATVTIGGTITGLTGTGLVLQNNGGSNLTVAASAASFTFSTAIQSGTAYSVTVLTQPTGQTCTVSNGSGTATANVTTVSVSCSSTATLTLSATVTGMVSGGTLILKDDLGDQLTFTANSTPQTFSPHDYASGATYAVTVLTPPIGQTCTVSPSSGTITTNTTVTATCGATANPVTIGGTLTGLATGAQVVIADNGAFDSLTLDQNGIFAFSRELTAGSSYAVTVTTQPTGQTCTVTFGSGIANANVTNVQVTCAAQTFKIGGTLSGLTSGTVVLQNEGADNLSLAANGPFTFATQVAPGTSYNVTVLTQPAGQACSVSLGSGVANTDVTTVQVSCSASNSLTLSVAATGLTSGTLTVQDETLAQLLLTTASPTQTFSNKYNSGAIYTVSIVTQPAGLTCTLGANASGPITANTTVTATCAPAGNTFTIGGTLYDLSANVASTGVILQDNAADNLTLVANGTFTFPTAVANGTAYAVTVLTQPTTPDQSCTVLNGTGTASANVTNVEVVCISEWTWEFGLNTVAGGGNYGTQGVASPTNDPGARAGASTWTDGSGTMWLFGGEGYDSTGATESQLNDLWKFTNGGWIWAAGSKQVAQPPVYPAGGVGNPGTPGARAYAVSWKDTSGNLWMFGGYGVDVANTTAGPMNDLWEFNGQWIWQGGSQTQGASGIYSGGGSFPGARYWSSGTADASGNLWMFGGYGVDSAGSTDFLNDLWEFSNGTWTFIKGSTTVDQKGTYGTLGTGAPGNVPGARIGPSSWIDSTGNFWLFGGDAADSTGTIGDMNDLWSFSFGSTQWTWLGGSNVVNATGNYGTQGIPDVANTPGPREFGTVWNTPSGDVWLLGGQRIGGAVLNDFWKYSAGQWTWMDGSQTADLLGVYGTLGTTAPTNAPGARQWGNSWTDLNGNIWLLGGWGLASQPAKFDAMNDLWEFQP